MIIAALLFVCACAARPEPATLNESAEEAVQSLLAQDAAFRSAPSSGLAGLTSNFDDEVVAFAPPIPGFARGRSQATDTLARALGASASTFTWSPIRAGISGDGQHGFTFGYVVASEPEYFGKYVAYWVRSDGQWRIRLYKLVPRPGGPISAEMMPPWRPTRLSLPTNDLGTL